MFFARIRPLLVLVTLVNCGVGPYPERRDAASPDVPAETIDPGCLGGCGTPGVEFCMDCDGSPATCETNTLLNRLHCGQCAHACGGFCAGGACQ